MPCTGESNHKREGGERRKVNEAGNGELLISLKVRLGLRLVGNRTTVNW